MSPLFNNKFQLLMSPEGPLGNGGSGTLGAQDLLSELMKDDDDTPEVIELDDKKKTPEVKDDKEDEEVVDDKKEKIALISGRQRLSRSETDHGYWLTLPTQRPASNGLRLLEILGQNVIGR